MKFRLCPAPMVIFGDEVKLADDQIKTVRKVEIIHRVHFTDGSHRDYGLREKPMVRWRDQEAEAAAEARHVQEG